MSVLIAYDKYGCDEKVKISGAKQGENAWKASINSLSMWSSQT